MLAQLFHTFTFAQRSQITHLRDRVSWPQAWKEVTYKQYPRRKQIQLPEPTESLGSLQAALVARHSERTPSQRVCDHSLLSSLLWYSAGINERYPRYPAQKKWDRRQHAKTTRRHYPSSGARYPLEVYVVSYEIDGVSRGVYHYHVLNHALEEVLRGDQLPDNFHQLFTDTPTVPMPKITFLVTAIASRNVMKYRDFGYPSLLFEAGHLMQNVHLVAAALEVHVHPFYAFNYEVLHSQLDLDDDELLLYATNVY